MTRGARSFAAFTPAIVSFTVVATWIIGRTIVSGSSGPLDWAFVAAAGLVCVLIFSEPLLGMYAFPFALWLLPPTYLLGVRFLSPPLLLAAITVLVGFARRGLRRELRLPIPVVLVFVLLGWHVLYFLANAGPHSAVRLYAFGQGSLLFFMAWVTIRSPADATRVVIAWVVAWTINMGMFFFDVVEWARMTGATLGTVQRFDEDLLEAELNVLAWIGTLFVPVVLGLAAYETRRFLRVVWGVGLIIVLVGIIATQSRAGILGALMVFAVTLILQSRARTTGRILPALVLVSVSLVAALVWYSSAVAGRFEGAQADILGRMTLWLRGLRAMVSNPIVGVGPNDYVNPGTHSYVVKSAMEYGIGYFLAFAVLYWRLMALGLRTFVMSPNRLHGGIALGITAATAIAIPQSLFGNTFQSSMWAMVFWTLQGAQIGYAAEYASETSGSRAPIAPAAEIDDRRAVFRGGSGTPTHTRLRGRRI